jgi:hypothetical protein
MPRKTKARASPKDTELAKHYGQIGISAVAAAARYQPSLKNSQSAGTKRSDNPAREAGTLPRGTSARR